MIDEVEARAQDLFDIYHQQIMGERQRRHHKEHREDCALHVADVPGRHEPDRATHYAKFFAHRGFGLSGFVVGVQPSRAADETLENFEDSTA